MLAKIGEEIVTTDNKNDPKKGSETLKLLFQICTILITGCCLPLIAWSLTTMVSLKVDLTTEKAIRETEQKNMCKNVEDYKSDLMKMITSYELENNQRHASIVQALERQIESNKIDFEKRFSDYKIDSERRFQEIQKQLEQLNTKLDKALDMLLIKKVNP